MPDAIQELVRAAINAFVYTDARLSVNLPAIEGRRLGQDTSLTPAFLRPCRRRAPPSRSPALGAAQPCVQLPASAAGAQPANAKHGPAISPTSCAPASCSPGPERSRRRRTQPVRDVRAIDLPRVCVHLKGHALRVHKSAQLLVAAQLSRFTLREDPAPHCNPRIREDRLLMHIGTMGSRTHKLGAELEGLFS